MTPKRDGSVRGGDVVVGRVTDRLRRAAGRSRHALRRLTARNRPLPDFVVIGAQRCGTSSLYRYLVDHPAVQGALRKETHFFNWHYQKGLSWYRAFFPSERTLRRDAARIGRRPALTEATPYYLFHPLVPGRIAEALPEARFIVILRDPVERAFSQFRKQTKLGRHRRTFEQAIELELDLLDRETQRIVTGEQDRSEIHLLYSYLARGRYAEQLERWFELFPRERFLILRSEDFYADPGAELARTIRFLELPEWSLERFPRYMVAPETSPMRAETRRWLESYFAPHNRRLTTLLGRDFGWSGADQPAAHVDEERGVSTPPSGSGSPEGS